jgi:hypothetical protein
MDLEKILAELRKERDAIEAAISNLERLSRPGKVGPGGPTDVSTRRHIDGANGFRGSLAPEESR